MLQGIKNLRIVSHLNKSSSLKENITIKLASTSDEFFKSRICAQRTN